MILFDDDKTVSRCGGYLRVSSGVVHKDTGAHVDPRDGLPAAGAARIAALVAAGFDADPLELVDADALKQAHAHHKVVQAEERAQARAAKADVKISAPVKEQADAA